MRSNLFFVQNNMDFMRTSMIDVDISNGEQMRNKAIRGVDGSLVLTARKRP